MSADFASRLASIGQTTGKGRVATLIAGYVTDERVTAALDALVLAHGPMCDRQSQTRVAAAKALIDYALATDEPLAKAATAPVAGQPNVYSIDPKALQEELRRRRLAMRPEPR